VFINNPVAVFDSGIGSLSIIKELKKEIPSENLLYLADKAHFTYGSKSHSQLRDIITNTIRYLERFKPKLTVIASNTPSVQLLEEIKELTNTPLIGVTPPLKEASKITKKKHIGIMATAGTISSEQLQNQIRREIPQNILITRFNASPIIDLIENGTYINNERKTFDVISKVLGDSIDKQIDVITLSSTHLHFVKKYLNYLLPTVKFLDPASIVARDVRKFLLQNRMLKKTGSGRLRIMVSKEKRQFEKIIHAMGIKESVEEVFIGF